MKTFYYEENTVQTGQVVKVEVSDELLESGFLEKYPNYIKNYILDKNSSDVNL